VKWKPIETAPKDRTAFLVYDKKFGIQAAFYSEPLGVILTRSGAYPLKNITHWMPLPEPPKGDE